MGCDRYPDCDYTRDLSPELSDGRRKSRRAVPGMRQGNGDQARKVRNFPGVQRLPECKTTLKLVQGTRKARQPDEILEEKCPDCGEPLVKRFGDTENSSAHNLPQVQIHSRQDSGYCLAAFRHALQQVHRRPFRAGNTQSLGANVFALGGKLCSR